MKEQIEELRANVERTEMAGLTFIATRAACARAALDYIAQLEQTSRAQRTNIDGDETVLRFCSDALADIASRLGTEPSEDVVTMAARIFEAMDAAPAAGQAGLANLQRYDIYSNGLPSAEADGPWLAYADVEALFVAPVAADTEQATIDTAEFRALLEAHRKVYNAALKAFDPMDDDRRGDNEVAAAWDALINHIDSVKLAPLATPADAGAGLTPLDYRAQGREEALQIILAQSSEDPFADCIGWSRSGAPEDEGGTYWDEDKLRALLHIADRKHDAYDRAEAAYWDALGRADEAKREMLLVEQAPFYKPLSDFLSKHEAWDLMADLKREADARLSTPKITRPAMTDDEIDQIYKEVYAGAQGLALVKRAVRAAEGRIIARLSTPGAPVAASQREAFEAWMRAEGWENQLERYNVYDPDDTRSYKNRHTADKWEGWEACAKFLGQSPAPVTAEPVASIDTPEFRAKLDAWAQTDCDNAAATADLISYIDRHIVTHSAPADRDAIRDQALEEVAMLMVTYSEPGYVRAIRALKSMVRAADAKGGEHG